MDFQFLKQHVILFVPFFDKDLDFKSGNLMFIYKFGNQPLKIPCKC